eukprot:869237-Rhodomonas_salina.1
MAAAAASGGGRASVYDAERLVLPGMSAAYAFLLRCLVLTWRVVVPGLRGSQRRGVRDLFVRIELEADRVGGNGAARIDGRCARRARGAEGGCAAVEC